MLRTVKAMIDKNGRVKLAEPISLRGRRRALVTILDDEMQMSEHANEAALFAETALAKDWIGPKEDAAWNHLTDLPDLDKAARGKNGKKGRR